MKPVKNAGLYCGTCYNFFNEVFKEFQTYKHGYIMKGILQYRGKKANLGSKNFMLKNEYKR